MTGADDFDRLAGLLGAWAADTRARDAAAERTRRRHLADQAAAEVTLAGALTDLAEAGTPVAVRTASTAFTGAVTAVGLDFCVVAPTTVVALAAVVAVEPAGPRAGRHPAEPPGRHPAEPPGRHPAEPLGGRPPPLALDLADVAAAMAADRMVVVTHLRGGTRLQGTLTRSGPELLVLTPPPPDRRPRLVPLAAVEALVIAP